jgi:chemotaxis family two-component system response regulator Rcp1
VPEILLVDDNPSDVLLTREALADSPELLLHVAGTGEEGLERLRGGLRPDLVLLDLALPGCDGREVLAEVRADTELTDMAVVVLTASEREEDVLRAFGLDATGYLIKPPTAEALQGWLT